jgi:hypothetical protein
MAQKPVANQPNVMQANMMARNLVLERAVDMTQSIFAQTLTGNPKGQVVNVPLRNVGLIKRLIVEISCTVSQAVAETLTRTALGPSNLLSQIVLTDLNNQTRINTTGWHMHMLATARRQAAYGAAFTNDSPVLIGSNVPVSVSPTPVTAAQTIRFFYEIPVAYSDYDLRGAIFANVVNATMNLQLTVNPNFVVASTGNPTLAGYISSSTDLGTLSNFTINVYQNYLDQLPQGEKGAILPLYDLSTVYLLNNTVMTGLAANQDNPIPYANFRSFMSTFAIYDNFGSATAVGAETNYWSIQSANYTNIIKYDPYMAQLQTRNIINDDFPAQLARNTYYFDHRRKPINTIQYGNMQLIFNPAQVQASTSQVLIGFEALALQDQITQAGSLYGT